MFRLPVWCRIAYGKTMLQDRLFSMGNDTDTAEPAVAALVLKAPFAPSQGHSKWANSTNFAFPKGVASRWETHVFARFSPIFGHKTAHFQRIGEFMDPQSCHQWLLMVSNTSFSILSGLQSVLEKIVLYLVTVWLLWWL